MKRLLNWFERKKHTDENDELSLPTVLESKFEPQNRLEELLIEAGYDPNVRPTFESELLEHEVFVAIRDDGQPHGQVEIADDAGLGIYSLQAADGSHYPAGFTALERGYECFGPDTLMAKMTGHQLLQTVVGSGLWMNPASPFGVLWSTADLKRILSQ
ncbi:MAG: SseB family protein [Novosphingobium sp.]|uniref:SseB family protein n=1 Tax=Novosphingobium sp. TaxID=1874826 RepID=UPI003C79D47F